MGMQAKELLKVSKQAFNRLVEAVGAGQSDALRQYLGIMGRFHKYSFGNAILIGLQSPEATHVAGFHTWRKLGRSVRKGEKGIAIMAPILYRKSIPAETEQQEDIEMEFVHSFKAAYVFDISQTEGKELPQFAHVQGNPGEYLKRLRAFIDGKGIELQYCNMPGTTQGLSAGGKIVLREGMSHAEEFSTLVHELAHEQLHRDEESRQRCRNVKETEAEAVAYVVCEAIGLDTNTSGSDYIQLYDGDKETLMKSLTRIQSTASEIINAIQIEQNNNKNANAVEILAEAA